MTPPHLGGVFFQPAFRHDREGSYFIIIILLL